MTLLEAYRKILSLKQPVIQSRDAAAVLDINPAHGSKIMNRLADAGFFARLNRGNFADLRSGSALEVAEFLAVPFPSYISLQTALFYHGMISQIPEMVYLVTAGRPKTIKTPVGVFSIHHISPNFFFGYEPFGDKQIKMATPEKALLDFLYFSPARSSLFSKLPELELPKKFSFGKCREIIAQIPGKSRQRLVENRLREILKSR